MITTINLTTDALKKAIFILKPDKASRPDNISSKLLKCAGNAIVSSLMSVFAASAASYAVPATWKSANESSLCKSGDETDKQNYRPISLLCVPGKLMEPCVGPIITTHTANQDLSSSSSGRIEKATQRSF